jgi:hypothetical protein
VPWRLTVRSGPRVTRERFKDFDAALDALRARASELAEEAPRAPVDVKIRQFEPVQQVAARLELAGPERLVPSVRAGVDVRGDGSTEAFVGRVQRQLIEPRGGEDPYEALAREIRARVK